MLSSAITSTSPPPVQCKEQPLEPPKEIWGVTLVLRAKKQVGYPELPVLSTFSFATRDMLLGSRLLSCQRGCLLAVSRRLPKHPGLAAARRGTCSLKAAKVSSRPWWFWEDPLHSRWSKVAGCSLLPFTVLLFPLC